MSHVLGLILIKINDMKKSHHFAKVAQVDFMPTVLYVLSYRIKIVMLYCFHLALKFEDRNKQGKYFKSLILSHYRNSK